MAARLLTFRSSQDHESASPHFSQIRAKIAQDIGFTVDFPKERNMGYISN